MSPPIELIAASRGATRLAVAAGSPAAGGPTALDLVEATTWPARARPDRRRADGLYAAIAETGTIILTAQPHEGRRALTLVPDLHICVVRESQIHELVPEALGATRAGPRRAGRSR